MRILITGATGLLGKKLLIDLLKKGHTVIGIGRDKNKIIELPAKQTYSWDALSDQEFPQDSLKHCDAVIHLAGEPVAARRWNDDVKKSILDSRTIGTQKIISAFKKLKENDRPKVFIAGSAIGFYGDQGEKNLTETADKGSDFLADVVQQWELESIQAKDLGIRTVILRTGIVLARSGGALEKMPPLQVGRGDNFMSWIHIQDWTNFAIQAVESSKSEGIYNLVSPHSVTQTVFIADLAQERHVPFVMTVPKFVVSLALGEMAQVLLSSQKVQPKRMLDEGFKFQFAKLKDAFKDIYRSEDYLVQDYTVSQFVPDKIENVFEFFSAAKNLEQITPEFLNCKVKNMSSKEIEKDTIINYKLKIHGIPASWQTQITEWVPLKMFVDNQNKGPYTLWNHTHTFTQLENGTLIEDRIKYKVPGHLVGLLALGAFIRKDVSQIFRHRIK
ncbi:MAG: TIGR01777 family protein, partial [Bdellovibrionaceae bacterium]|nr:TIGR01777 family protein [Pseudobdellovibrionaceae bacterium]